MTHPLTLRAVRSRVGEVCLLGRTLRNFISGFVTLNTPGPCVTVFGSARIGDSHPYYAVGRAMGRRLSELGVTVMTGGGPGLMEAANRGAKDAGGRSVACNIRLPIEQLPNSFLDRHITCHHFFVRKVLLFKYSHAFVVLPGGYGTMDELFEALTLIQTGKVERFPIVLIGMDYWRPLLEFLRRMVDACTIDAADLELLLVTDDVEEAVQHVGRHLAARFDLRPAALPIAWPARSAAR
jgi:hypothetical protein